MKIKEGFKMRELGNEYIVIPESSKLVNFNKIVSFNSTTAYLWESVLTREFTVEDLKRLILEKYEVDEQTAARDAAGLAQSWIDAGLVSE